MTSPALSPAFSAGDPAIVPSTARRHAGPSGVHVVLFPDASTVPMLAPIPSNSPAIPWRDCRYSSGVRYWLNGSLSAAIIPLMAPWTSAPRSTVPPA